MIVYFTFQDEYPSMKRCTLIGLPFGGLILLAPAMCFVFGFYLIWALLSWKSEHIKRSLLLFFVSSLVLIPWTVRNAVRFERFVFISSNGGFNLLMGNNPQATPASGVIDLPGLKEETKDLNEFERDAYYRKRAITYIRSHPRESIKRYALKFLHYFDFRTDADSGEGKVLSRWKTVLSLIATGPLLLFGIVFRILFMRRIPLLRMDRFILLLYILNGAFTAVFFTRIRFRVPFDALLTLVAVLFAFRWLEPSSVTAKPSTRFNSRKTII